MTHIAAQQPTQPPPNLATSAGSAWAHEKRFAGVLDRRMAYVQRGAGHPIVLLHGNPTSSFLWRNVLPHVEAPGLLCMADNSTAAEALHRRGARRLHHGPDQEAGQQLP